MNIIDSQARDIAIDFTELDKKVNLIRDKIEDLCL